MKEEIKKLIALIFTLSIIIVSKTSLATNSDEIIIKNLYDGLSINYKSTIINIIENEPITFITNGEKLVYLGGNLIKSEDIFETGESRTNSVLEYEVDILKGSIKEVQEDEIITQGKLLIETNVARLILDQDGIFLEGKNRTYLIRNGGFDNKNKYKLKFKEVEKEKEESRLKEENEDLRKQIKEIRDMLRNGAYNNNSGGQTGQVENVLKHKGDLTVTSIVPETLKDDIFIELEPIDGNGEISIFYLSPNNGFANKQTLLSGDYIVKDIYFLNDRIKGDYTFQHNKLVKILEGQSIYLAIETLSLKQEPIIEEVKAKGENEEKDDDQEVIDVLNSLEDDNETDKKDKKTGFFIILILGLGVVFLVFKYKDKLLYKD